MPIVNHERQFEKAEDGWIFYRTNVSKGYRVSDREKERLLAAMTRAETETLKVFGLAVLAFFAGLFLLPLQQVIVAGFILFAIGAVFSIWRYSKLVEDALPRGEPTEPRQVRERVGQAMRRTPYSGEGRRLIAKVGIGIAAVTWVAMDAMLYVFIFQPAIANNDVASLFADGGVLAVMLMMNVLPAALIGGLYIAAKRIKDD